MIGTLNPYFMKKTATIKLQGKDYATVPARIKEFREDCPNGKIETSYEMKDGQVVFTAHVIKDKSKADSAEANGHAIGQLKGDKAFEKLETISIGRALAILGYMASGEIASSEEMEEFMAYQVNVKQEAMAKLATASTLDELKTLWSSLGSLMADPDVIAKKDELKLTLK